ncbi:glycosyltransferase [Micromonospora matsumotoense]|uniref:glycosyltransferase n=1 Tax=Micromonospora matsumotoense TaxID=121616 RepID=UPI0033E83F56
MIELLTRPVRWAIRRGYQPADGEPPPTECVVVRPGPDGTRATMAVPAVAAELGDGFGGGLALVLPTYVGRAPLSSHRETVEELVTQLTDLPATVAARPLLLVVGMQWRDDQHDEAIARLERLSEIAASRGGLTFVGIAMPQAGKSRMLNAAFEVATGLGLAGVAWVDDDVTFSAGCIGRLLEDFLDRGARGSAGASKVPQPNPYAAARLLHRGKQITKTPKFGYPHGCCMVIDAELVARGIPDRYTCEDDYFCFALLDPRDDNPLHRTHIVADAVSYHLTGGPAGEIRHRVNRSLLTAAVLMADFPADVAGRYWRMYFYGLWPLAPAARGEGLRFAAKKWLLKSIHFGWFSRVALGLAVRGVAGRPRREIPWSAYTQHAKPTASSVPLSPKISRGERA